MQTSYCCKIIRRMSGFCDSFGCIMANSAPCALWRRLFILAECIFLITVEEKLTRSPKSASLQILLYRSIFLQVTCVTGSLLNKLYRPVNMRLFFCLWSSCLRDEFLAETDAVAVQEHYTGYWDNWKCIINQVSNKDFCDIGMFWNSTHIMSLISSLH